MLSFLNKPYPHSSDYKRNILVCFCIGAFVALFLIIFQPFEINLWKDPDKKIKLAGFGVVSFVIPVLFNLLLTFLPLKEREDNWKVWKELVNIIFSVLLIATGNLFYSTFINIAHLNAQEYIRSIFITFTVGIFPISFSVVSKYNKFLRLNQKQAAEINTIIEEKEQAPSILASEKSKKIMLIAENEKDKVELEPHALLYIESADNYSMLFLKQNDRAEKALIRGSLKRMEVQVADFANIIRCHRAFIVNLENVVHIEGNAAGYKLSLKNTAFQVPVSRNYGAIATEKLKKLQVKA